MVSLDLARSIRLGCAVVLVALSALLAAPASPASAGTGCYAKDGSLTGGLVVQRASGCEQVALSGNRLAVATSEGDCLAKEGAVSAPFVTQWSSVSNGSRCVDVTLAGNRIGVRTADGNCRVREGSVGGSQTWYPMWGPAVGTNNCTQLVLTDTRVGVMHEGGDCSVKENLFTTWHTMWGPGVGTNKCTRLALEGTRVGVMHEGGDCSVKATLFGTWATMWGPGVGTNRCSELRLGGNRVGVRHEGGDCSAKNDMFTAWMTQWGPGVNTNKCAQLALSGSRVGVRHEGNDCGAKEPALDSQWVTQFSAGCRQVEVTDTRVAVRGDAPAGRTETFNDSFEGGFAKWGGDFGPDPVPLNDPNPGTITAITPSGYSATHATKVMEAELQQGDVRAEIMCRSTSCKAVEGDERWYEWDLRVPAEGSLDSGRTNVMQTKSSGDCYTGGLQLEPVSGTNRFRLYLSTRGGTITETQEQRPGCSVSAENLHNLGEFTRGEWHHVLIHVKWHNNPAIGFTAAQVDGITVRSQVNESNHLGQGREMWFRLGLYGPADVTWRAQYDDVHIYR